MLTGAVYRSCARLASLAAVVAVVVAAHGDARAEDPAPQSRPIRVDLARGPVISSGRITGLGGAYAGVAVGIDGVWRNPATLANRPEYSTDWFDYDLTLDWLITSAAEVDFDGDGYQVGADNREFRAVNVGGSFQFGSFAFGLLVDTYGFGAKDSDQDTIDASFVDALMGVAYAASDGEWIGGLGVLVSTLEATATALGPDALELTGAALDVGVLYRPPEDDWRLGGRIRFGTELGFEEDTPSHPDATAAIPWQIALGASMQWAIDPARRYNAPLRSKPPTMLDHRYLLVSSEVVLYGVTDGQSLEALVDGVERRSGRHITASLHLGAEGEVFDDRVRARLGTYFEPNRVAAGLDGRLHVTGGIEIRLAEVIWMWKATFGFDLAPGWENISIGVGFWK